jgi:hypothetical protein
LGIVEGGYLEEQRRQLQEVLSPPINREWRKRAQLLITGSLPWCYILQEKRTQKKKERDRYKSDRDKDAQKRRIEILLSIVGSCALLL